MYLIRRCGVLLAGLLLASMPALAVGENIWQLAVGGPDSDIGDLALVNAVAVDTSGNVVVTGQFQGSVTFGGSTLTASGAEYDIVVAKYTSGGAHSWSQRYGSTGADIGFGIGTDSSGNVYVIGSFSGSVNFGGGALPSAGNTDIFVLKLSSAGAFVWAKRIGGTGSEVGRAISVMADGTFAITGDYGNFGNAVDFGGGFLTPVGGPDIFIAKYDSAGAYIWAQGVGGTSSDDGLGVAINSSGEVAMTGYFKNTVALRCSTISSAGANTTDGLVLKYNTSGALLSARRFGGTSDDRGIAVAMSTAGDFVITGTFNGTANFGGTDRTSTGGDDIFIAQYSSSGLWAWDGAYGTSTAFGDTAKAIAMDASGNVAITGYMLGPTNFGGGALCPLCGTYDVFLAKFTNAGVHVFSTRFPVNNDDHGYGIAFDASGNEIIVGDFFDGIDFGGGAMSSPGGVSGFIAKFNP